MISTFRASTTAALLGLALSACSSTSTTPAAPSTSNNGSTAYSLYATVTIPNVPKGSWFDISYVDASQSNYLLADRSASPSTAGVAVVGTGGATGTPTYVRTAGAGFFQGVATAPAADGAFANNSGPNGVVPVGGGVVFAGDGNSNLQVVNESTGQVLTPTPAGCQSTTPPLSSSSNVCGIWTGGQNRVDEGAYDPADNIVVMNNDVENGTGTAPVLAPNPFGTFFSAASPYTILGKVQYPTAAGTGACASAGPGLEQPTWDPSQGVFLQSIPCTTTNPGGEVDLVSPKTFSVVKVFPAPANCNPNGSALGPNEELLLGCSTATANLVVMNATNGATLATITGAGTGATGGADEVWYNPGDNRFVAASGNNTNPAYNSGGGAAFVIDAGTIAACCTLVAAIPTSTGAHSVAVDPATNRVYLPQRGSFVPAGLTVWAH